MPRGGGSMVVDEVANKVYLRGGKAKDSELFEV